MIPVFDKTKSKASDYYEFDGGYEYSLTGVSDEALCEYLVALTNANLEKISYNEIDGNKFFAYALGDRQLNISYYSRLTLTTYEYLHKKQDGHTDYTLPSQRDTVTDSVLKIIVSRRSFCPREDNAPCELVPSITQMRQIGIGMSYCIRLCDGSFAIIDGGLGIDGSLEYHLDFLLKSKPEVDEKPRVRWFFTHAHPDHIGMAAKLLERHADKIQLLYVAHSFMDESTEYASSFRDGGKATLDRLKVAFDALGVPICVMHSGDRIMIPGCEVCVLSTHEDLFPKPLGTLNTASAVFKMVFHKGEAKRSVMFLGDTTEYNAIHINGAYSQDTLKSDILQVAHHGENASAGTEQLRLLYNSINPEIALCSNTEARIIEACFAPNKALEGATWIFSDSERTIEIF